MKLEITLSGKFYRLCPDQVSQPLLELGEWILSFQQVATKTRQRSPQLLKEKFGLSFLTESSIVKLLVSANQTEKIYHLPLLKWLKPPVYVVEESLPRLYEYKFVGDEAQLLLEADDAQLPVYWTPGEISQNGVYQVILENGTLPGLSETWVKSLWLQARNQWQSYGGFSQLQRVLNSRGQNNCFFTLQDCPDVKVKVESEDISQQVQEALAYIQKITDDFASLSTEAQNIVQEYQLHYSLAPTQIAFPDNLTLTTPNPPPHQMLVGKKNSRRAISSLITQAEKFLCVSSYIIEDENITELICQKVLSLPQGVWILTDLRDEVVNKIDTQTASRVNFSENYPGSTHKKAKCLGMLLDAGARIAGGRFHLKTYISEKAAYLGSSNLTGGSLDFNLEAGLVCQGSLTHQQLYQYFLYCWLRKAAYEILPTATEGEFIQRSLNYGVGEVKFSSANLLTPTEYKQDLETNLSQFTGTVEIYSRGFSADSFLLSLLKTRSTRVYFDGYLQGQNPQISWRLIPGIHAKITLLGDQVAYVGGVNFQLDSSEGLFHDLMYKTRDRREIKQIRQQLSICSDL